MMLHCTSQDWDADGSVPYDNVQDFLTMCREVHGEEPSLTEGKGGSWVDGNGDVILRPSKDADFKVVRYDLASGPRYVATAWSYEAGVLLSTRDRESYTAAREELSDLAAVHGVRLKWFQGEFTVVDGREVPL